MSADACARALLITGVAVTGVALAQVDSHEGHGQPVSESEHVPPDPPADVMHDMPYCAMAQMMAMDDTARFGKAMVDHLDLRDTPEGTALGWDAQAWYGSDYDKLWFKTEGQ